MKFRKKPVVIDAFQWTGDIDQAEDPEWACEAIKKGDIWFEQNGTPQVEMRIKTLESQVFNVSLGDYVIRGIKGEIYACKPDIFEASYEKVEEA